MLRSRSFVLLVAVAIMGGVAWVSFAEQSPETAEVHQRIEVYTGDRIRLTHHDQTVSEGLLVSIGQISVTLADTGDISKQRVLLFRDISEFEVARAGSSLSVKAFLVDRAWLTAYEAARADSEHVREAELANQR